MHPSATSCVFYVHAHPPTHTQSYNPTNKRHLCKVASSPMCPVSWQTSQSFIKVCRTGPQWPHIRQHTSHRLHHLHAQLLGSSCTLSPCTKLQIRVCFYACVCTSGSVKNKVRMRERMSEWDVEIDVTYTMDTANESESDKRHWRGRKEAKRNLCTQTSKALWEPQGTSLHLHPSSLESFTPSNLIGCNWNVEQH